MRIVLDYHTTKARNAHVITVDRSATSRGQTITARTDQTHLARVLLERVTYLANVEEAEWQR